MNQQGIRSDGAVCIRCHDYCVLVVDHYIPEECKTDKFLSDLDTIILLRWTKWNAACVSQFLNEIINRRIPSIAGVPSSNASSIHSRLCCLILPGFTYKGNYTLSVTEPQSGHPIHKDDTDATFRLAMELGVHVLQLHESTNSLSFGLHIRGSSNYQSALKTNNTKHEGSSVSRHGGKYTHAKNVGMVLYQKYGVGCLQLVPMFETQSDDSCGFSALFRWMPHRASWPDEERASQYMVCCTQEILQTTTNLAVNHAPKDSQEPLSVLKSVRKLQLLVENLMLICDEIHSNENTSKTSPTNKPSFRSGLTKSQAFVTALKQNGSLSKPYAR
ncbi:unnamed protein product [Dicrocoelium dendriticum]|nr:unnamed protein product [Dicrocoelium dendriticum]